MSKTQVGELKLSEWLKAKLKELDWTQRRLAEEARTTQTTVSEIINEKQGLSAELAAKLAAVPELQTTKEELMLRGGVWEGPISSSKKDVVVDQLDKLSDVELELTLDFVLMLQQRTRKSIRKNN
jgi:transcriptional regulator with XRE-family HTH domain